MKKERFWLSLIVTSLTIFTVLPSTHSGESRHQEPQQETVLPAFPTGAVASFPDTIQIRSGGRFPVKEIYIQRSPTTADATTWVAQAQELIAGDPSSAQSLERGVGFVVPPLDRGTYRAWYRLSTGGNGGQSMEFNVIPQLIVERGLIRDRPGNEVSVRVHISSPSVYVKGNPQPVPVSFQVTLQSSDSSVAELASGQSATVATDAEGVASWRVLVKKVGGADLTFSSQGFEQSTTFIEGLPPTAQSLAEAQAQEAEARAAQLEAKARLAAASVSDYEMTARARRSAADRAERTSIEAITESPNRESQRNSNVTSNANTSIEQSERAEPSRQRAESSLEREAREAERQLASARETAQIAAAQAALARSTAIMLRAEASAIKWIRKEELKPGDVFLVQGGTCIISDVIRLFEGMQLGGDAPYSHASLYLGEIHGTPMVAEMWSSGYWITPLDVSLAGAKFVDVYRWKRIDSDTQNRIAEHGKTMYGSNPDRYISYKSPDFRTDGSPVPYAYGEIALLGMAAIGASSVKLNLFAFGVDRLDGGKRRMICSEFVDWVYSDLGLDPEVKYWPQLLNSGIISSTDRRRDYTTPNMLARSLSFENSGRLLGP